MNLPGAFQKVGMEMKFIGLFSVDLGRSLKYLKDGLDYKTDCCEFLRESIHSRKR
jgi:hypothetical protein